MNFKNLDCVVNAMGKIHTAETSLVRVKRQRVNFKVAFVSVLEKERDVGEVSESGSDENYKTGSSEG